MDIMKGSLDNISRPASSERSRPGSRVSSVSLPERGRVGQDSPRLLVVLSPDVPEMQDHVQELENNFTPASTEDHSLLDDRKDLAPTVRFYSNSERSTGPSGDEEETNNTDLSKVGGVEENEDPILRKAIVNMRRLDKMLATSFSKEREVKRKGRELHQMLWAELQESKWKVTPERHDEAENTRMFLALSYSDMHDPGEEVDFTPVFGTQVLDDESDRGDFQAEGGETGSGVGADSPSLGHRGKTSARSEGRHCGVSKGRKIQDFVKKNIELVKDAGSSVLMTDQEKKRLAELLQDVEDAGDRVPHAGDYILGGHEVNLPVRAFPVSAGQGYAPEPDVLEQLLRVDSRLQLLLPVEDFLSIRSGVLDHRLPQDLCARQDLTGEKVLQGMRETRSQEMRLKEIEEQLEELGQVNMPTRPVLLDEELRSLLDDCVVALSRTPVLGTPEGSGSPEARLTWSIPRLSLSVLSDLLGRARGEQTALVDSDSPFE